MSALIALTRREIQERRPLLWGTLCAALIPVLARLLWWLPAGLRRDYHETLGILFAINFPIALALGLGASVIGEDLANRRLGFYFSRPVPGFAIWATKSLAAVLITLAAWAAFLVPMFLLAGDPPSGFLADIVRRSPGWYLAWFGVLLGLIFVAQAVAGAYRARDGLIAVDIALFALLVSFVVAIGWRMSAAGFSLDVHGRVVLVNAALAVVALAAGLASAAQVVVGRTDARRGHLALSICLWGTLAAAVGAAAVFSRWVLSVGPHDTGAAAWSLRTTASASHVTFLAGRDRAGYSPAFLVDTRTGDFEAIPAARVLGGPSFSEDGRRVVWIEDVDKVPTLVLRQLDGASPLTIRTGLSGLAGSEPQMTGLSPDGRAAILAFKDRIFFVDADSGREAASFPHSRLGLDPSSPAWRSRAAFTGDSVWLFFTTPPAQDRPVTIVRANFRTGQVTPGPRVQGSKLSAIRDGRALIEGANGTIELVEAGEVVSLRSPEAGAAIAHATLLEDGSVVALLNRSGVGRLLTFDRNGRPRLDTAAPAGQWRLGGEPRPGWLALAATPYVPQTAFVDLSSGTVVRTEDGLLPAAGFPGHEDNLPAGSKGSRLFVGTRGEVVLLDPETGRREAVLVPPREGAE